MTVVTPVDGSTSRTGFAAVPVASVERLCEDAVAVTFDVPAEHAGRYAFRPGQHVAVRRVVDGVEHRRSYSVCATVGAPLRVGVRRVPDGVVSRWLVDEARPGDLVELAPPTGRFTLDPSAGGRHVLVGAGSGVTPLLSIAGSLLECSDAEVTLVYGNRRTTTAMFLEELADLKDRHPARLQLIHVLSREPREVELLSGRLDGARLERLLEALAPGEADGYWLCGPHLMVQEHRAALARLGVAGDRVHAELFYVDEPPPPVVRAEPARSGPLCDLVFSLDGRASEVAAEPGITVLDAARSVRPEVPFACRGGVCGTCRARVVAGEARMRRNFALEPGEVDAGFVLTCQAVPTGDRLRVDFDA